MTDVVPSTLFGLEIMWSEMAKKHDVSWKDMREYQSYEYK